MVHFSSLYHICFGMEKKKKSYESDSLQEDFPYCVQELLAA